MNQNINQLNTFVQDSPIDIPDINVKKGDNVIVVPIPTSIDEFRIEIKCQGQISYFVYDSKIEAMENGWNLN